MEMIMLIIFGAVTMATALMVIFARNTIHSALWLIASFCSMAVIYLLLHAEFIAILQIIVYAGAIMMFIIYAIMMLDLRREEAEPIQIRKSKVAGVALLGILFLCLMVLGVGRGIFALRGPVTDQLVEKFGHIAVLSNFLFSDYLLPFEVVSILLTAGVVGSVFLAKRT